MKLFNEFDLTKGSTKSEIKQILTRSPQNVQFHCKMNGLARYEEAHEMALIQKVPNEKEMFFLCYSVAFGMTEWKKININELVQVIDEAVQSGKSNKLEQWNLITPAQEGKAFGEY